MVASVHGVCACGHELQSFDPQCPSCGKQLSAPNVRMALAQRDRLHSAYHLKRQSTARGLRLEELEACIGSDGRIVVNMRYSTIRELLENPQVTYGNFWQDFVADRIVERNEALVARRMQVDAALFAQHTKRIRSAVLSPDGLGATFYGRFAVTLRQLLIADRTSLLENNPFN